jgi:hypothetical protein
MKEEEKYCISCLEPCKEEEIVIDGICIGCAYAAEDCIKSAFYDAELPEFSLEKRYEARIERDHKIHGIDVDIFGETQDECGKCFGLDNVYVCTGLEICAYVSYCGIITSKQVSTLSWQGELIFPYDWYEDDEIEEKLLRIKRSME